VPAGEKSGLSAGDIGGIAGAVIGFVSITVAVLLAMYHPNINGNIKDRWKRSPT